MAKLKIVMVCHFSNELVRKHLNEGECLLKSIIRKLFKKPIRFFDFAQWNTNAIREFQKFIDDVELHVICPSYRLKKRECVFTEKGIHYYFFRDRESFLRRKINQFYKRMPLYEENRSYIKNKIAEIQPDLVHIIGAENPNYSLAALDIPDTIPSLVQLQTLMIDPDFKKNYPLPEKMYEYRASNELKILENSNYIGTTSKKFISYINSNLKIKHPIIGTTLALTEPVDFSFEKKEFDFVYFSWNINKAVDFAIEAFAIACKKKPSITLDIVGGYSAEFKAELDSRIEELGLKKNVFFEGAQATHDDVIRQIKKSRFALLPLKIDLISGTVRESMANGLPVVTTITPATPKLNEKRESVLLSSIGDHNAMAENMLKLLNDSSFAKKIQENAGVTASERQNNELVVRKWIAAYHACIENFKSGTPIPQELLA